MLLTRSVQPPDLLDRYHCAAQPRRSLLRAQCRVQSDRTVGIVPALATLGTSGGRHLAPAQPSLRRAYRRLRPSRERRYLLGCQRRISGNGVVLVTPAVSAILGQLNGDGQRSQSVTVAAPGPRESPPPVVLFRHTGQASTPAQMPSNAMDCHNPHPIKPWRSLRATQRVGRIPRFPYRHNRALRPALRFSIRVHAGDCLR